MMTETVDEKGAKKTLLALYAKDPETNVGWSYSPTSAYTLPDAAHWIDEMCGPFDLVYEHHAGGRSSIIEWWFHPVGDPQIYALNVQDIAGGEYEPVYTGGSTVRRRTWHVGVFHFRADYVEAMIERTQDHNDLFSGVVTQELVPETYRVGKVLLPCHDVSVWKGMLLGPHVFLDEVGRALVNARMSKDLEPWCTLV